jgi:large subunit ribosomal protein L22
VSTPETQEVRASANWVRITPRKARLVVEHIRGRTVPEARTVLAFTQRAAAREVEKLLRSAVANAEANHGLIGDDLVVKAAYVDEGPMLKRWRARARGRSARIRKRTCHITIALSMPEGGVIPAPRPAPMPLPAAEPAAEEEEKPKRAPRKKAEEPAVAEEAPKPKKPRAKKAETEEKPTARTTKKSAGEASKTPRRKPKKEEET